MKTLLITMAATTVAPVPFLPLHALAYILQSFHRKKTAPRRMKVLRCPETGKFVDVDIEPYRALSSALGTEVQWVKDCSLWPERKNCSCGCLKLRILEYLL